MNELESIEQKEGVSSMVHNILLQKFNNIKLTELTGGYTNTTLLLEGSNPLVMAKIFNKERK
ncbi:hypothetical protein [Paenibacillus sp. QZ-Y1]|uniref:hypothetical protein n=1 Tax=Paenibacillus sp. QZ-Y1 TaxID=3414511 RepID=UPI003F792BEF